MAARVLPAEREGMRDIRNLSAATLPRALVERIPELTQVMEEEAASWGGSGISEIGPDTAFSLVLAPFVIERLERPEGGEDALLQRIFAFLEELTHSEDPGVLSAIDVSFGEELLADEEVLRKAWNFMGPRLRETFEFVQSRRNSLPGPDSYW